MPWTVLDACYRSKLLNASDHAQQFLSETRSAQYWSMTVLPKPASPVCTMYGSVS